ncbi:hypothetical protein [Pacificispira sp.]|uniref:hypothetical protein n=1 Tax=Pacificispira sp. TaxID=2888761 RepID=UPI003B5246EE
MADNEKANAWSDAELKASVIAYLEMLYHEQNGVPYSKAQYRRRLVSGPIAERTEGSIEYRMQNISAVLQDLGHSWIEGYKPAQNVGEKVKAKLGSILSEVLDENDLAILHPATGWAEQKRPATKPTRGPAPRREGYTVSGRMPDVEAAYTYIAQFGDTDVFKVRYSNSPERRLNEFNDHIPYQELQSIPSWHMLETARWTSLMEAYCFEQDLLRELSAERTIGERVRIPLSNLRRVWAKLLRERPQDE